MLHPCDVSAIILNMIGWSLHIFPNRILPQYCLFQQSYTRSSLPNHAMQIALGRVCWHSSQFNVRQNILQITENTQRVYVRTMCKENTDSMHHMPVVRSATVLAKINSECALWDDRTDCCIGTRCSQIYLFTQNHY